MVIIKEEGDRQVAGTLEEDVIVMGHLNGVDVAERSVMAEHLDVDEADNELLHLAFGDVWFDDSAF